MWITVPQLIQLLILGLSLGEDGPVCNSLQDILSWEDDINQGFDAGGNNVSFCWDRDPFRYHLKLDQSFSCKTNVIYCWGTVSL